MTDRKALGLRIFKASPQSYEVRSRPFRTSWPRSRLFVYNSLLSLDDLHPFSEFAKLIVDRIECTEYRVAGFLCVRLSILAAQHIAQVTGWPAERFGYCREGLRAAAPGIQIVLQLSERCQRHLRLRRCVHLGHAGLSQPILDRLGY